MRQLKRGILFTPRTPRCKILVAVLTIALMPISTISYSQDIVLDSLPVYEQSYRNFMLRRWTADRKEFVQTTRKKWWYYLPNVGYSFGFPSMNINTGILAQIDRDKQVMSARLVSLDAKYQVEFVEQLVKIRTEHRKLQVRHSQLLRDRRLVAKLGSIMDIHNEAFNKQTMTPEEHLRNSFQYEKAFSELKNKESELMISILDFFALCRFELPDMQLASLASDEDCPAGRRDNDTTARR